MTTRPASRPPPTPAARIPVPAVVVLAVAAFALYLPSVRNGFVWDDVAQVVSNPWLRDWRHLGDIFASGVWDFEAVGLTNYFRPLMHLCYLLLYTAVGPTPWAYHLLQVTLHAANAVLVVVAVRTLLGGVRAGDTDVRPRLSAPLLAGVLFAFHPVNSEAVLWVAALPELGATACGLGAAILYVRALRAGAPTRAFAVPAVLFLASALFKETGGLVGPFLVACDLALAPGDPLRARARRIAPFVAASVAYLVLRYVALGDWIPLPRAHGVAVARGWLALPATFAQYLATFAWPVPLNAWREFAVPGAWSAGAAVVLAVSAAFVAVLVLAWRRDRVVALGLTLFLLTLLPAFFTSAISGARIAERYLYLPTAGAAVAAAALIDRLRLQGRRVAAGAIGVYAVAAAVAVWLRVPDWQDELALWTDTVSKAPAAAPPRFNLGVARMQAGDVPGAIEALNAALDRHPEPPIAGGALNDLGRIAERQSQPDVAIEYFRRAVALQPDSASARSNLGGALAERGRLDEALPHLAAAVRLRPSEPGARLNLALVLIDLGRRDEALEQLSEAARLAPHDREIQMRFQAERARAAGRGEQGR